MSVVLTVFHSSFVLVPDLFLDTMINNRNTHFSSKTPSTMHKEVVLSNDPEEINYSQIV